MAIFGNTNERTNEWCDKTAVAARLALEGN